MQLAADIPEKARRGAMRCKRHQPVRQLRAHGATLKANSDLRGEAPSTIAVLRALVNLGGGVLTYLQIGKRAGGVSWRQVQRVVAWAAGARLIHATRLGKRGQLYVLMPTLAANFLGAPALKNQRRDMPSKSHQGRRDLQSLPEKRKSAPRCDAAPTPRPPPQIGAGETADSGASPLPGRGATSSVAPENFAARAATRPAEAAGRLQRSPAAAAPTRRNLSAEDRARIVAETRASMADIRKHDPPRRRR